MIHILFLCAVLWLLAVFAVNLTLTGKTRRWLCGLLRILLLFAILAFRTLIQMGVLLVYAADFRAVVLLCAALACGHFFASDLTLYVKERTPAAAKSALITASITLLLLMFIISLTLHLLSFPQ